MKTPGHRMNKASDDRAVLVGATGAARLLIREDGPETGVAGWFLFAGLVHKDVND